MKKRMISVALALCLCVSSQSVAYASQEGLSRQGEILTAEVSSGQDQELPEDAPNRSSVSDNVATGPQDSMLSEADALSAKILGGSVTRDGTVPTPAQAYAAMIALKEQDAYKEGTTWTDYEPYSDSKGYYRWKGGTLDGKNIAAVGCVAFAFILSDAAFGSLPNRMYASGEFSYEDIKVGDILRVNNDTHTVIVLEVRDVGVVVAEGNIGMGDHQGKVHWGRTISKEEVMGSTSHYITRYPENYIPPDDPEANQIIGDGTLDGGLAWKLTKAGTLTISGKGAMPDFSGIADQPWKNNSSQIRQVVIEDGVTSIGACAFWNCQVLGANIPSSVTAIGNNAFYGSSIISVTIPSSVKTIGNSAFYNCQNLSTVTVCDGVETIGQNAFRACTSLGAIALPASIGEVGSGAFFQCTQMKGAAFAPGSKQVKLGDDIFAGCYWLMNVTLPQNIDRIGNGMFRNCGMLAGVEIPQGAESIGGGAFASCTGLTTLIIPDSVMTIGSSAFSRCPLKDIYFTGTEEQWNNIGKQGDTGSAVLNVALHYNYIPVHPDPDPNPDGDGDNNPDGDNDNNPGGDGDNNPGGDNDNNPGGDGDNNPGGDNDNNPGGDGDNNPGGDNGNNPGGDDNNNPGGDNGNNPGGDDDNNSGENNPGNPPGGSSSGSGSRPGTSSSKNANIKAAKETWKPVTPDEKKRYACVGKENIRYTVSKENAYPIAIENAMQGSMCFKSFEAALGGYTIGRTYNIYPLSDKTYSMDKEVRFTVNIPSALCKKDREYKMICVTEGGQPIVYKDLDSNPDTITIKTNKFYAYALIYK
ncbi:MAG: leucine-rich repeat domain-containing protein [Lachnospiraceae bacterium]|nr:leucine-rich repeat domain-containing protein [Lachnospiraceae bacterium]